MSRARMFLVALVLLAPATALAHGTIEHAADPNLHVDPALKDCSVQFAPNLTQDAFRRFAREFGSVSAFKLMASPMTLGQGHGSIGLEYLSFTVEEHAAAWNDTFYHPDAFHELGSEKVFPKARVRVGVTDDLDLGAYWTRNPDANYGWLGLEAKYGLLRQSETAPMSLAVRGAYTKTLYVSDMDMHTVTADVAAGRTFRNLITPYVALGSDLVLVRERSAVVDLARETLVVPHAIGGVEMRYWHVAIGGEVHVAALTSFELQLSALF